MHKQHHPAAAITVAAILVALVGVVLLVARRNLRILGRFVWDALRPFGTVMSVIGFVFGTGLVAILVRASDWFTVGWAVALGLGILAILFLWHGYELRLTLDGGDRFGILEPSSSEHFTDPLGDD